MQLQILGLTTALLLSLPTVAQTCEKIDAVSGATEHSDTTKTLLKTELKAEILKELRQEFQSQPQTAPAE